MVPLWRAVALDVLTLVTVLFVAVFIFPLGWPLLFVSLGAYRAFMQQALRLFLSTVGALITTVHGTGFAGVGSLAVPEGASGMVLSNHRTRLDWLYTWVLFEHCNPSRLGQFRVASKADLRKVPYIGWNMQVVNVLFLQRAWEDDEAWIIGMMRHMAAQAVRLDEPFVLLLYPEGTDLSMKNLLKSWAFSAEKRAVPLVHVLHPRKRGTQAILETLRTLTPEQLEPARSSSSSSSAVAAADRVDAAKLAKFKAEFQVMDLTLAYEPVAPQTELMVVKGNVPHTMRFWVRTAPLTAIPPSDVFRANAPGAPTPPATPQDTPASAEAGDGGWITRMYLDKEVLLSVWHQDTHTKFSLPTPGMFPDPNGVAAASASSASSASSSSALPRTLMPLPTTVSKVEPLFPYGRLSPAELQTLARAPPTRLPPPSVWQLSSLAFTVLGSLTLLYLAFHWPLWMGVYVGVVHAYAFGVQFFVGGFDRLEVRLWGPKGARVPERAKSAPKKNA